MADANGRGRFVWYDLMTSDPKKAEAFYTKVVGWGTQPFEGMPYTMWTANGTPIGGVGQVQAPGTPPHWLAYIGVTDVDAAVKQAEGLGGKTYVPGTDIPTVGRFAVLADPQGAVFAVFTPTVGGKGRDFDGDPKIGEFSWHELMADDSASAFGFYQAITPRFVAELAASLKNKKKRVPILIDSRYALTKYRGLTACTPNESEVEQVLGVTIDDKTAVLERAGRTLLKRTRMDAVLVTRGSRGMALFEPGRPTVHIPIFGSDQIADVTGAGDTVMATMTLALAAGATFEEAARLANYAGGLVVMKRGTATVSAAELRRAVSHG